MLYHLKIKKCLLSSAVWESTERFHVMNLTRAKHHLFALKGALIHIEEGMIHIHGMDLEQGWTVLVR